LRHAGGDLEFLLLIAQAHRRGCRRCVRIGRLAGGEGGFGLCDFLAASVALGIALLLLATQALLALFKTQARVFGLELLAF